MNTVLILEVGSDVHYSEKKPHRDATKILLVECTIEHALNNP